MNRTLASAMPEPRVATHDGNLAPPSSPRAVIAPMAPASRQLTLAMTSFVAISAVCGGLGLLLAGGGSALFPPELLAHTPFASFFIPGLLLTLVVGGSNAAGALLLWRRARSATDAILFAGGALTVWIAAELAMMRTFHELHAVYGALGLAIVGLGIHAAWTSRAPRHRWVLVVTLAESLGFLVPTTVGALTAKAGLDAPLQAGWIVAAGLIEGLFLGAGQAWAFPLPVGRARYALLTALGAGVVWAAVMSAMTLMPDGRLPIPLLAVAGAAAALVGLTAIGTAQWLELRRHTARARGWIAWTALAWSAALPFSFAPGLFVDRSTPIAAVAGLWMCGGVVMAYVMAVVTWQGVRRMVAPSPLWRRFVAAAATLPAPTDPSAAALITDADLAPLPEPVRRYLRFMGAVGRPRDHSFRVGLVGRFKVGFDAPWRRCEAWQYNTGPEVTRTFLMGMRFGGLPVIGRDTYRDGQGRMLARLLDRLTVVDGRGSELDIGELSTYLNDLVLLAPTMLLTPAVTFAAVDDHSFDVALRDHDVTVRARVFVDDRGAPTDFVTADRFCEDPQDKNRLRRARWSTPVAELQVIDGRTLMARGRAVWHLPEGDFPYADFRVVPDAVAFNVPPGA